MFQLYNALNNHSVVISMFERILVTGARQGGEMVLGLGARGPTTALGEAKLDAAHVFLGGNGAFFVFLM